VNQDLITPLAPAVDPAPPKKAPAAPAAAAPAAPAAPAVAGPAAAAADQGAQEVAKSLAGATFREDGSSTNFTKAAGTVDDRFDALLKSVDARHSVQLRNAVAVAALRLVAGGNATSPQAVRMSKMLAVDLAAGEAARQRSRR